MTVELTPLEARIIGCLIEKEVTTPDYYPLSLNSLTAACNQKSNRDPVMSLAESDVQSGLDTLMARRLVSDESSFNSRTSKYQHRFCNTEFGDLKFSAQERGIICCLLLRGPQTPGELRTRTNRLCDFTDVKETEQVLEQLAARDTTPLVVKLAREPGKRESRYQHLFCGAVDSSLVAPYENGVSDDTTKDARIAALELEVASLKEQVQMLTSQIGDN
jgi:uncharacterized protein YceH (UPF0502 family)